LAIWVAWWIEERPVSQDELEVVNVRPLCFVDGQRINIDTMETAVSASISRARRGVGFTFFTLNLDHLCKRRQFDDFRACYDRATFISADGAPIVWLGRAVRAPLTRTTGADLLRPLVAGAAREGVPVYFFGTSDKVLSETIAILKRDYPELIIAGAESPPMDFDPCSAHAVAAAERIGASGAGLCFVALGAPKQEIFADLALRHAPKVGFLCVGAALDFISGAQRRAPEFMARNGLEWLWRLSLSPRRLFARYFDSALMLLWLSLPWQFEVVLNAARPQQTDHGHSWQSQPRPPLIQAAPLAHRTDAN
jgi:exopolysaccharide biosynthesis WecB/TagA/CpsF family protein